MNEIYFIKNQDEYNRVIFSTHQEIEIYYLDEKYPYFKNKQFGNAYLKPWEETPVSVSTSYWLHNYKNINELVNGSIRNSNVNKDNIVCSDYFKFDVVEEVGKYFLSAIDFLDSFFTVRQPRVLYCNDTSSFISSAIKAISENHGIEIRKIC
ncbi:MAG: hypothetical protein ABIH47_07065 [Candidatus Omnitrophota bacterium]